MSSWKNIFKEAGYIQYKSWKTSKVMKFKNCFIFQACKFMEFYFKIILESHGKLKLCL